MLHSHRFLQHCHTPPREAKVMSSSVLQISEGCLYEVDIVQDQVLASAILKGFDASDGYRRVSKRAEVVREG
ncbi:hypothetical protein BC937DRAFT_88777 [Endogone sp. FLAS-F59071]|nr:hypothetical protein BC937DRAFT_88777 [Endogone sp. FLAS-F59071]|eukprot:RUS18440.1 hypothetical protein BC937DRAFT_88777 [Endogone sp. FLAS-F59071]